MIAIADAMDNGTRSRRKGTDAAAGEKDPRRIPERELPDLSICGASGSRYITTQATAGFGGADIAECVRRVLEARVRHGSTSGVVSVDELIASAEGVRRPF